MYSSKVRSALSGVRKLHKACLVSIIVYDVYMYVGISHTTKVAD